MTSALPFDGFLAARLEAGDDGKALLIGLCGTDPAFAVAAGLRGPEDHPGFAVFARYLLHQRFGCDGYVLMLPALHDGVPVYLVEEWRAGAHRRHRQVPGGAAQGWPGDELLIDGLERPDRPQPGLRRREMDRLYETLKLPLPARELPA